MIHKCIIFVKSIMLILVFRIQYTVGKRYIYPKYDEGIPD